MWRIGLYVLVLAASLIIMTFSSIAAGQVLGSIPNGLEAEESCVLPCWNGIRPGETTVIEADSILRGLDYDLIGPDASVATTNNYESIYPVPICQVGLGRARILSARISEITLQFCEDTALGHLNELVEGPESFIPYVSMLSYHKGEVIVILRSEICRTPLTPHNPILFISLTQPISQTQTNSAISAELATQREENSTLLPWEGYLPLWRYNQLYPGRVVC
jgi:hypothetical protein